MIEIDLDGARSEKFESVKHDIREELEADLTDGDVIEVLIEEYRNT